MTPRELKAVAARRDVRARVISDGCRDYIVEVLTDRGAGLLRRSRRDTMRFRSLGEVHQVLHRCGIEDIVLRHRVAQDEASGHFTESYHDQPLKVAG